MFALINTFHKSVRHTGIIISRHHTEAAAGAPHRTHQLSHWPLRTGPSIGIYSTTYTLEKLRINKNHPTQFSIQIPSFRLQDLEIRLLHAIKHELKNNQMFFNLQVGLTPPPTPPSAYEHRIEPSWTQSTSGLDPKAKSQSSAAGVDFILVSISRFIGVP